jgi:hypothetical protein
MSTDKKPRADALLKTLPPERQAEIYRRCNLPVAEGGGYTQVRKWLADDGFKTSETALSLWWSWYGLQQQLQKNASTVETLLANMSKTNPDWTPDQIQQAGQAFFSSLALEQQDAKSWFLTQQLALKREAQTLDRQKFQRETCELFVKWSADKEAQRVLRDTSTNADKIEKLGELMFGPDWKE